MVRDSWNATTSTDMTHYLRWVMANLRDRGQKVNQTTYTYITYVRKCWVPRRRAVVLRIVYNVRFVEGVKCPLP